MEETVKDVAEEIREYSEYIRFANLPACETIAGKLRSFADRAEAAVDSSEGQDAEHEGVIVNGAVRGLAEEVRRLRAALGPIIGAWEELDAYHFPECGENHCIEGVYCRLIEAMRKSRRIYEGKETENGNQS